MNKLLLGRYIPGTSWIHDIDPRAKLASGVSLIVAILSVGHVYTTAVLWIMTYLIMRLTGIRVRTYIRGVKPLIWIIVFTVVLQIFFTAGGTIYWAWGPLTVSQFGLQQGYLVFTRFVLVILLSTVITLTTRPTDLSDALYDLLRPLRLLRLPIDEFAFMLSISLRLIPDLLDEAQRILDAQRLRGADIGEGSLLRQMRSLIPVVLPLFQSSLNRADRLAYALEVRGFRQGIRRSRFRRFRWQWKDTITLSLVVLFTLGLLLW